MLDLAPALTHKCDILTPPLQRYDCKDFVSIFTCKGWQPVTHVAPSTTDLADLAWSPDGSCFVVWDSPLAYKMVVHAPDGSCLAEYSAYSDALGIKSLQWSPSGQMLCLGSYDQACFYSP